MFLKHQVSLSAGETVRAKHAFEQKAASYGVNVKAYRADNMPFKAQKFVDDLKLKGQGITYSGTGAHHQNGVAENSVRTITRMVQAIVIARDPHVAGSSGPQTLAVCHATRCSSLESITQTRWLRITRGAIFANEDTRLRTFAKVTRVGMSNICIGPRFTRRKENS